MRRKNRDSRMR